MLSVRTRSLKIPQTLSALLRTPDRLLPTDIR